MHILSTRADFAIDTRVYIYILYLALGALAEKRRGGD